MSATLPLADLLRQWTPGDGWSWDEEEAELHSRPCYCQGPTTYGATATCPIPGHYQKQLEAHLASVGEITQGVCLGDDGRVWDGHHRIVAARRLGFESVPIEDSL